MKIDMLFRSAGALLPLMFFSQFAYASLGGNAATVQADRAHMKAIERAARSEALYTVNESTTPSGTVVKQYIDSNGTVFAVTWEGPAVPDLRQLLGNYFDAYTQAGRSKHRGHGHLSVTQSDLVVQSSGHARAFAGKAYVPSLVPQGVAIEDLQ
jgi:hypothetical protein